MMTRVYAFIHDLCFFSFFLLATVVPILFTVRLGLALFSSDRIEACYIKNQAEGYVLIEQRRWQVIPQEVKLATLAEAVSVAKTICPTTGGN